MSDCTRCHGAGYVYITNGDNDHTCPSCAGTGERQLTLPEALWIVSSNAQGAKHNYFDEYLPSILLVNSHFPVLGYNTIEDDENPSLEDILEQKEMEKWGINWDEK